ncbi:hypothetical protein [Flavobacterium sp.]|uniref:hypothetical protein n=1 Tax=Flavobacterium sp. TaxID=239 RepID=UPI003A9434D2
MHKTLLYLFLFFTLLSCKEEKELPCKEEKGFTIKSDTIELNIKGRSIYPLKYKGIYYSDFIEVKDEPTFIPKGTFCVFNKKGKILSKAKLIGYGTWNTGIYVQNDSIVLKENPDMPDAVSYYWDKSKEAWLKTKVTDDGVFEDDNFYVYALDYGEWGAATIFKDKKTGIEYDANILLPRVYNVNGAYYLVTYTQVVKVTDPRKLNKVKEGFYYNKIKKDGLRVFDSGALGRSLQGVETVYKSGEEAYYYNDFPEEYIAHAFVYNNELFLIMVKDNTMYVARINNGALEKVKEFRVWIVIGHNNPYRNAYLNEGVGFYLKEGENFKTGLLEIKCNTIYLHYIKTKK